MAAAEKNLSFVQQVGGLPFNFWVCNIMEMLERLAFFGVRAVVPLYLVAGADENGLSLDFAQKGWIFSIWALLQCLIPMVSGGYTDRYGYRVSLAVAFFINICGYLLMAWSLPVAGMLDGWGVPSAGFITFLAAACLVATGTAIFKPPVQGTIAKTTTEATSSVGWGVFYWVVNIGGFLAPMTAATLRGDDFQWHMVFYGAAIVTALNYIPAFLMYREPERVASEGEAGRKQNPFEVFFSSVGTIFTDLRFVVFLLIFSCFWLMFMQLWDLLPNFIDEWVHTQDVAGVFGTVAGWIGGDWVLPNGEVKPEMIINIDAFTIILLVIPLSWLISRLNKVAAMIIGMLISLVGFVGAGATNLGAICCLMIFIFAIGEIICSPTFSAYVGLIAPPDKKALYMGYSNIPFAIGWAGGNLLSGYLYENLSSKVNLARHYFATQLGLDRALAMNEEVFPDGKVVESLTYALQEGETGRVRDVIQSLANQAEAGDVSDEVVSTAFAPIVEAVDHEMIMQATDVLWEAYDPQMVWWYLGAIGLAGTLGMIVFYFTTPAKRLPADEGAPPEMTE